MTLSCAFQRRSINVFYFHSMQTFQAFSYRILPETSRNLSDERRKHLHVNFIQYDSDAEPTNIIEVDRKNTANHNRANLVVLFLNQSEKKVRICPFYMRSDEGIFQALFLLGYKRKGEGLIVGYLQLAALTERKRLGGGRIQGLGVAWKEY